MSALWINTAYQFKKDAEDSSSFCKNLIQSFENIYGHSPSQSEIRSWEDSIPRLAKLLEPPEFYNFLILIEMNMKVTQERADYILLGGNTNDPKGLIIEVKQWSKIGFAYNERIVSVFQNKETHHTHPIRQAENYKGKLLSFSDIGSKINWSCAAWLPNMGREGINTLRSNKHIPESGKERIFGTENHAELRRCIESHLLPASLNHDFAQKLSEAPASQTSHLFEYIAKHADEIITGNFQSLCHHGFAMTEEQEILFARILDSIEKGEEKLFLVQGQAGSGKTLMALHLLLRLGTTQKSVGLGVRSPNLLKVLRKILNAGPDDRISRLVRYIFTTGTDYTSGLINDREDQSYDVIICDETQRIQEKHIPDLLKLAPILVLFLDENQCINPKDDGTVKSFKELKGSKECIPYTLENPIRCRGGRAYHKWVEELITRSIKQPSSTKEFQKSYDLRILSSAEDLITALEEKRKANPENQVALIASYTESSGYKPYTERIGHNLESKWGHYKDCSLSIPWIDWKSKGKDGHVEYWLEKQSNHLNSVASIYGCQGFEADYVGIIWGRDYIYRKGKGWILGDPKHCYDTGYNLVTRKNEKQWCNNAITYLQNRYRIFLTRGIKGTYIYFEDEETGEYLKRLWNNICY